ncbi:hypothetical protein BCR32DRAFT_295102 [Anaeromyces robustus]|uniref:Uncharacterized protein n=1 Tax=Anaeromyces robustus TaxID=1754192 RepID=A0A1Y1WXV0_9FUNG|nr:hypothetical protein BCR32DRAFT_295102 [Anaeromyces robustus]|eukprot:ORX78371.1 hypothetical protein BCR32DRAFT_295102 [Anaeromyces robustus]
MESEKLIVEINPKVDIAFKGLFINNKKMMIDFLNNIFDSEIIIDDLEYKNIKMLATNATVNNTDDENSEDSENTTNKNKIGKLGKMDTLLTIQNKNFKRERKFDLLKNHQSILMTAKTNHNKLVNIEILFNKTGHMFKRSCIIPLE